MMRALIKSGTTSVLVAISVFSAFVAAALWLPQDQQAIRSHIVAAIQDGTFNAQFGYGPFGSLVWPRHTMDCALASMMIAPPASLLIEAVSNRMPAVDPSWRDPRVPDTLDCQALVRAVSELGAGYGDVQFRPVDRYIMGVRVFARVLLSTSSWERAARVMRGISFALLGVIGLVALLKLRHATDSSARLFPAAYLAITVCLALLYGVHYFDATFFFAPPDYVHFIFILISIPVP